MRVVPINGKQCANLVTNIVPDDSQEEKTRERMHDDRRVSELLLRACHDLRAPLRSIRTHAELLHRGAAVQPPASESLNFIVEGARRIDSLVDGLSHYSVALQLDDSLFQSAPMDVLLRSVLAKLKKELSDAGAQVNYRNLPRVRGNPDRLMEVFENLLRNALAYRGSAAPLIEITAEEQQDRWVFAVRDNGPGIAAGYLEKIFQPFEHLDTGGHSGVGLGLAICRTIVLRHGGEIWAESQEGNGATLYFTLPV